ncbi:O-methyltransferase-domain-containing protein [Kockovaella imperatae]|uniref:O-methyltransferase-domain-containing protein n=1 Tax=Kockovaella imperatae TaxID=4999 RepID=A0A1Y1UK63_9TREE|nr:O-methyltransferase-domain-containing protein [Kockovaella imperatae]ORX38389.1 O-methyltransferase-domain-containing protein [Kockovaella imperatae]
MKHFCRSLPTRPGPRLLRLTSESSSKSTILHAARPSPVFTVPHHHRPFTMSADVLAPQEVVYSTNSDRPPMPSDVATGEHTAQKTDAYLDTKLLAPGYGADQVLEKCRKRAHEAGIPEIAVSPQQGQLLSILAKSVGASKILEIGTLWGYSTVFLARSLPKHGQIDTLEIDPLHAKISNQTFIDADLYPFPKIHIGKAVDTLKGLSPPGEAEGLKDAGYDFVFIDADKGNIPEYFQQALRLSRKGALIFIDNAIRGGRITSEYRSNTHEDANIAGLRKFYDWAEKDNGKTVLLSGTQTVGAKHWDGFVLATKL